MKRRRTSASPSRSLDSQPSTRDTMRAASSVSPTFGVLDRGGPVQASSSTSLIRAVMDRSPVGLSASLQSLTTSARLGLFDKQLEIRRTSENDVAARSRRDDLVQRQATVGAMVTQVGEREQHVDPPA